MERKKERDQSAFLICYKDKDHIIRKEVWTILFSSLYKCFMDDFDKKLILFSNIE